MHASSMIIMKHPAITSDYNYKSLVKHIFSRDQTFIVISVRTSVPSYYIYTGHRRTFIYV